MKKILKGLTALAICGALNLGLTTDAQAMEFNSIELQELSRRSRYTGPPPPLTPNPRHEHWRRMPPPLEPPPPPKNGNYWGKRPPPPPLPQPPHRW